jgi:hypothetical protein
MVVRDRPDHDLVAAGSLEGPKLLGGRLDIANEHPVRVRSPTRIAVGQEGVGRRLGLVQDDGVQADDYGNVLARFRDGADAFIQAGQRAVGVGHPGVPEPGPSLDRRPSRGADNRAADRHSG